MDIYDALERWAAGELRSVNGQIEYVLREALARAGRLPKREGDSPESADRDDG